VPVRLLLGGGPLGGHQRRPGWRGDRGCGPDGGLRRGRGLRLAGNVGRRDPRCRCYRAQRGRRQGRWCLRWRGMHQGGQHGRPHYVCGRLRTVIRAWHPPGQRGRLPGDRPGRLRRLVLRRWRLVLRRWRLVVGVVECGTYALLEGL